MPEQLSLFEPLEDFRDRLPEKPYCGRGKSSKLIMSKVNAIGFPYIQVNFPRIDYLCFDCDYEGAAFRPLELDIPGPTLTAINTDNGHAHLMYELLRPIPRKHSKDTKKLLRYVIVGYTDMLYADRCITTQKQLVKNALHSQWEVIEGYKPFSLTELSESIPSDIGLKRDLRIAGDQVRVRPFEETLQAHSRNCSLFESGRLFAYSAVRHCGSQQELYDEVLSYITELNVLEIPRYFPKKKELGIAELRYIAKSVSAWTYQRRNELKDVKRGAMGFEPIEDLDNGAHKNEITKRQGLSARRTNAMRRQETERRILEAISRCADHGFEPTAANIKTLSGLSRRTVYKHIDLIEKTIEM